MKKHRIIEQELVQVKEEQTLVDGFPGDVQRVLLYLHDHLFEESCNVNAILECSGATSPSIRARFKYHVGMKIHGYLTDQRMRAVIRLLRHNTLEIYVIAFSVGYANYRTFDRAFKRCVGCTPTAYREKMSSPDYSCREKRVHESHSVKPYFRAKPKVPNGVYP